MNGVQLQGISSWLVAGAVFAGCAVAFYLARTALYRLLARHTTKTQTQVDDLVVSASRLPSHLWVLVLSALVAVNIVRLPDGLEATVNKILVSLLIISFTLVTARLLVGIVQRYSARWSPEFALATTGVTQTVVQSVVILMGTLVLLSSLGINIAPLLGALGVGGLAAGLALQPTLSNLFAGFQIAIARQIRPGQRVHLDSNQEGYVTDISWRTTTLRTPSNHLIIIPNARLAESIVTNYDMPDPPVNIILNVGVAYESNSRRVEQVLLEEARRIRDGLPGLVREFDPIVRFQSFGDSSLNFLIILRADSFDAQFPIWAEIHHRIFEKLQREGIEIPFPVRTIHLRGQPVGTPSRPNELSEPRSDPAGSRRDPRGGAGDGGAHVRT